MYDAEMWWVLFRYAYVLYNDEETAKATVDKYTERPPVLKFALDVKLYREPVELPRGTSYGFSDMVVAVVVQIWTVWLYQPL